MVAGDGGAAIDEAPAMEVEENGELSMAAVVGARGQEEANPSAMATVKSGGW